VSKEPAELDLHVPPAGYAWWYVDGLSDDGEHGLTLIAFIGSVFSPYYFAGRRLGRDDPREYCSLNVCLYGAKRRWTMTERRTAALSQSAGQLAIGPSRLAWDNDSLTVDIDELGAPVPQRVRGRVRIYPHFINDRVFALDDVGRHRWSPIAPSARIEVALRHPEIRWSGHAYFDRNWGDEPIEDGFVSWDWSRAEVPDSPGCESAILYNMERRQGGPKALALRFSTSGVEAIEPPPNHALPKTPIWQISRASQADADHPPEVEKTLEDTPFYCRSIIRTHLLGRPLTAMHESLSLDRFRSPIVQRMLPFRMRRQRS
jgi:carotenoid 1,2-hydratase